MELLAAVLPGWLGVEYRPLDPAMRQRLDTLPGAAVITRVHPYSPAAEAGLLAGDIILGPPGAHFRKRAQLREWVTTALADQRQPLDLLRDGRPLVIAIRVGTMPDS
jgi:S1-C subfamily serine protease